MDGHFRLNHWPSHQPQKVKIKKHRSPITLTPAGIVAHVWKPPEVAQAYCVPQAGEYKLDLIAPVGPHFGGVLRVLLCFTLPFVRTRPLRNDKRIMVEPHSCYEVIHVRSV